MTSSLELSWAAGFLEGEGCFTSAGVYPRVTASQVQLQPLAKLKGMFGGSIQVRTWKGAKNPIFVWTAQGVTARSVMMTVFIFLSPKRRSEVRKALALWLALPGYGRRYATQCRNGHPYDDNSNTHRRRRGRGWTTTRICCVCLAESGG